MAIEKNPTSYHSIGQMLYELSVGNTSYRLLSQGNDPAFETLAGELNSLALRLEKLFRTDLVRVSHTPYQHLSQIILLLDKQFNIVTMNQEALEILRYSKEALSGANFKKVLAEQDLPFWLHLEKKLMAIDSYYTTANLLLLTQDVKIYPVFCTLSKLASDELTIITTLKNNFERFHISELQIDSVNPNHNELELLQKLHTYIIENLEHPLPPLRELANLFGSEEHRLKTGFRNHYQKSIYNFYHEARLQKAHSMIQNTNLPLKEIPYLTGFQSYLNFYKAFKKLFGYTPSSLSRPDATPEELSADSF